MLRKSYIISPTGHISNEGLYSILSIKISLKPVKKPSRVLPESPKKIFGSFKKEMLNRKNKNWKYEINEKLRHIELIK